MFAVSAIFTFKLILAFNKLAVSLINPCKTVESVLILFLKPLVLSDKEVPDEADKLLILLDKLIVSRANLVFNIFAVSAMLTFKFIRPFNALELSTSDLLMVVESNFNLVVIALESNTILVFSLLVKSVESVNIF